MTSTDRPAGKKPYLAGGKEFADIYGVKRLQVSQWISRDHVLDYSHAKIISGSPYWLLDFVKRFGEMTPRPKHINEQALAEVIRSQDPGYWVHNVSELPPLVGPAEVVSLFGLSSRQLLNKAQDSGRFRPADYTLSGTPIWLLDGIVEDAPALQAGARSVAWQIDEQVLEALRAGTYAGPGAVIVPRGPAARKVE
ncbi:hypothetical protein [Streptomyces spiramyceticus]|uniref:hypothetical protein n=1 Tax=Streptomyces spiramyceticus TaxID=299717 RepID=UPI00237AEA65|nr:hypothetical protein [Streptomyces spiramyceticus]